MTSNARKFPDYSITSYMVNSNAEDGIDNQFNTVTLMSSQILELPIVIVYLINRNEVLSSTFGTRVMHNM